MEPVSITVFVAVDHLAIDFTVLPTFRPWEFFPADLPDSRAAAALRAGLAQEAASNTVQDITVSAAVAELASQLSAPTDDRSALVAVEVLRRDAVVHPDRAEARWEEIVRLVERFTSDVNTDDDDLLLLYVLAARSERGGTDDEVIDACLRVLRTTTDDAVASQALLLAGLVTAPSLRREDADLILRWTSRPGLDDVAASVGSADVLTWGLRVGEDAYARDALLGLSDAADRRCAVSSEGLCPRWRRGVLSARAALVLSGALPPRDWVDGVAAAALQCASMGAVDADGLYLGRYADGWSWRPHSTGTTSVASCLSAAPIAPDRTQVRLEILR